MKTLVELIIAVFMFCFGGAIVVGGLMFLTSFLPFPFGFIVFCGILVWLCWGWNDRGGRSRVYEPSEDAGGL